MDKRTLLAPLRNFNAAIRWLAAKTHHLETRMLWRFPPQPLWHDHFSDQYWEMGARRTTHWLERGVFSRMFLKPGGSLLELCCGDGFYAKLFFSTSAARVLAVDADAAAIAHAKRFNAAPGAEYRLHDIACGLPHGSFDNIVWDGSLAYFTEAETGSILRAATAALTPGGILSGSTLASNVAKFVTGQKREIRDRNDLRALLSPHFAHVAIWETVHPGRTNMYFACSHQPLNQLWELQGEILTSGNNDASSR